MNKVLQLKEFLKNLEKQNHELLWAKIWDDTRRDIVWLNDLPGISPGRWAVGYNYIYVMTRILNTIKPESVLDVGLGISSSLIGAYFSYQNIGSHLIIEQDAEWVDFYKKDHKLSPFSTIKVLKCVETENGNTKNYSYEGFKSAVGNNIYNVISIDGPWGSERHSRRDIVELLPSILDEEFVIVMDDTNRIGEKDTVDEIIQILNNNNIQTAVGVYPGESECTVICSERLKFLCSL